MKRILATLASLLILVPPSLALAGPKEDVSAATQAWIDGMNSHNAERVFRQLHESRRMRSGMSQTDPDRVHRQVEPRLHSSALA